MTTSGGLIHSSFHPGLGRLIPLDRNIWTGSLYTDPRRMRVTTRSAEFKDQSPTTQAFLRRDVNVGRMELVFRASDGFPIQVCGDLELATLTVSDDGAVSFLMTPAPCVDPPPGLREYVQVDMEAKGETISISFYQTPDDRLAKHVLTPDEEGELARRMAETEPNLPTTGSAASLPSDPNASTLPPSAATDPEIPDLEGDGDKPVQLLL